MTPSHSTNTQPALPLTDAAGTVIANSWRCPACAGRWLVLRYGDHRRSLDVVHESADGERTPAASEDLVCVPF